MPNAHFSLSIDLYLFVLGGHTCIIIKWSILVLTNILINK